MAFWEKYLKERAAPEYKIPYGPVKTMKGTFYHPEKSKIIGWWQSEKLDGIHCIWTGKSLYTRNGNPIIVPDWWTLPADIALVGELYIGRGQFSRVQGLGTAKSVDPNSWARSIERDPGSIEPVNQLDPGSIEPVHKFGSVRFHVFDIPDCRWAYSEVYLLIKWFVAELSLDYIRAVEQWPITSVNDFLEMHRKLVAQGAEGSMIRDPNVSYQTGITDRLLKYKAHIDPETNRLVDLYDRNAIIIGYRLSDSWTRVDGSPAMKSLEACWSDESSIVFHVSSRLTKEDRCGPYEKSFPKGALINVLFNEINESGKPRFPRFGNLVH